MPSMDFREIHQMEFQICLPCFLRKNYPHTLRCWNLVLCFTFIFLKMNNLHKGGDLKRIILFPFTNEIIVLHIFVMHYSVFY